jgi:hypothetical protein
MSRDKENLPLFVVGVLALLFAFQYDFRSSVSFKDDNLLINSYSSGHLIGSLLNLPNKTLNSIELHTIRMILNQDLPEVSYQAKNLYLDFAGAGLKANSLQRLFTGIWKGVTNLTLILDSSVFGKEEARALGSTLARLNLKHIRLSFVAIKMSGHLTPIIDALSSKSLSTLQLGLIGCQLTKSDAEELSLLVVNQPALTHLEINLHYNTIGEEGGIFLSKAVGRC